MIITKEQADKIMKVYYEICDKHQFCPSCKYFDKDSKKCLLNSDYLEDFIWNCTATTNGDKFKEVFGFPIYELHQLSEKEEGEWLEKIYQKMD